ncbi:hypothetical protein B0H17DRAFT_1154917 [Mycena rosella]|uniref:Uncharacterized protein n=1 Tax=Mycena rosella TaxID=1033263 RepID=A0AAD7AXV3_MYCRO|nr:hypothetical protein B0H17DRAFT_1154917 [Mycena rosella]
MTVVMLDQGWTRSFCHEDDIADDIQRVMINAGQAAKAYLPQGVAAYLVLTVYLARHPDQDLTPLRPPFAGTDATMRSGLAPRRGLRSTVCIPSSTAELREELVTPPGSAFDATTAPPHSQRAGSDVVPPPAPHGILKPASSDVAPSAATTPPADDEDTSPQRKLKLLQRLKEKMHVALTDRLTADLCIVRENTSLYVIACPLSSKGPRRVLGSLRGVRNSLSYGENATVEPRTYGESVTAGSTRLCKKIIREEVFHSREIKPVDSTPSDAAQFVRGLNRCAPMLEFSRQIKLSLSTQLAQIRIRGPELYQLQALAVRACTRLTGHEGAWRGRSVGQNADFPNYALCILKTSAGSSFAAHEYFPPPSPPQTPVRRLAPRYRLVFDVLFPELRRYFQFRSAHGA